MLVCIHFTLLVYVPKLQNSCSLHINPTLLHIQVEKNLPTSNHYAIARYVPTTNMPLKFHICQLVHLQISDNYVSFVEVWYSLEQYIGCRKTSFHPLLWTSSGLKGTWKLSAYISLVSLRCAKTVINW